MTAEIDIPPAALEAAAISLMGKLMVSNEDAQHLWDKLYEPEKNRFRREAHTAIHAALAAWPGMQVRLNYFQPTEEIIHPLPKQEGE